MTERQQSNREDRVAIMTIDGGCTEEEAQEYCDDHPSEYGVRPIEWKQEELLK